MEKAIFELNEKLKHPSDVEYKLDSILNRFRNQNVKQLEKKHSDYLFETNTIKTSMSSLLEIKNKINQLDEYKKQAEKILKSNKYSINEYKIIKQIVLAHRNFTRTKDFLQKLNNEDENFNEDDIEEYANKIYENDEFLCDLRLYGYDLNPEDTKIVARKINQIKKTSLEFTGILLQIAVESNENTDIFDKINKIIRKEEKRDSIVRTVKQSESSNDPIAKQYYIENTRYINFEPKNLQNRFINGIKGGIKSKFEKIKNEKDFLAKLGFIFDDLRIYKDKNLEFFTFDQFLSEYHSALLKFLNMKLNNIEPEHLLGIIEFKSSYYKTIKDEYSRIPESLGPKLIENESELLKKYSEIASLKLKTWIDQISKIEIERFIARDKDLDRDEQNKAVSRGFINLLQIIKTQLEPISFNKKIFLFLTNIIKDNCKIFSDNILSALQNELKNAQQNIRLNGFEDYCILFGNSGLRLTQFIRSLSFFQSDEIKELQHIFLDILKNSNSVLCDYIIFTCKPVYSKIFTEEWYKKQYFDTFLVTLEDFIKDYKNSMNSYVFTTFICTLCTKICEMYRNVLKQAKIKINNKTSINIKNDITKITNLFIKYEDVNEFKDYFAYILILCPLIEAVNSDLFIIEVKSLILMDPDISKSFVELILNKKDDMNENEKINAIGLLSEVFVGRKHQRKTLISKLLNK